MKILYKNQQKSLLNLEILSKKYHIKKQYLIIPLLFIIFFFLNKKYFVFGAVTAFSTLFSYYHDKYNRIPNFDLKMPLFFGFFITRYYGIGFLVIFFIISDILPSLLAGGNIEGASILFIGWFFSVNALVLLFPVVSMVTLGIILVFVELFGSVIIKSLFGYPIAFALATSLMTTLVRIIYFLTLGGIMETIFNLTI